MNFYLHLHPGELIRKFPGQFRWGGRKLDDLVNGNCVSSSMLTDICRTIFVPDTEQQHQVYSRGWVVKRDWVTRMVQEVI